MSDFVKLVGIVIWPALILYVIKHYDKEIRELIKRIKKISGGGVSAEIAEEVNKIERKASEIPLKKEKQKLSIGTY